MGNHHHKQKIGFVVRREEFERLAPQQIAYGYSPVLYDNPKSAQEDNLTFLVLSTKQANTQSAIEVSVPTIALYQDHDAETQHLEELFKQNCYACAPETVHPRALASMIDTGIQILDEKSQQGSLETERFGLEKMLAVADETTYNVTMHTTQLQILQTPSLDEIRWRLQNNNAGIILVNRIEKNTYRTCQELKKAYPNIPILLKEQEEQDVYRIINGRSRIQDQNSYCLEDAIHQAEELRKQNIDEFFTAAAKDHRTFILCGERASGKSTVLQALRKMLFTMYGMRKTAGRRIGPYEFRDLEIIDAAENDRPVIEFLRTHTGKDAHNESQLSYAISYPERELLRARSMNMLPAYTIGNPDVMEKIMSEYESRGEPLFVIRIKTDPEIAELRAHYRNAKPITYEESLQQINEWEAKAGNLADINAWNARKLEDPELYGSYNPSPNQVIEVERLAKFIACAINSELFTPRQSFTHD